MSVSVSVRSYTHAVTYVADNILKSLKDIILLSGLDPKKLAAEWAVLHSGISTWITSQHLRSLVLEVFDPRTDALIGRWDVHISYEWTGGSGRFWADTDMIRFALKKTGALPSSARYRIVVTTAPGRPSVPGWSAATLRSTAMMVEQRIGTAVEAGGLSGGLSYFRPR